MKKIISFSGGRTSAYLCYLMKLLFGDQVVFVFMDTGAEHPKTYDFIRKCNKHFGLDLVCLRLKINPELGKPNSYTVVDINDIKPDLQPWRDMLKKYGTPYNPGGAFCTDRLKLVPWTKYLNEKYGAGNYQTYLGIRHDEPKRFLGDALFFELKNLGYDDFYDLVCIYESLKTDGLSGLHGWLYHEHGKSKTQKAYKLARKRLKNIDPNVFYMAEFSEFEKQDVIDWWSYMPFDLEIEEHLGNCVFCIKKGINKIALAAKDEQWMAGQFWSVINDESVRIVQKRKSPSLQMYRGKQNLGQIIALSSDQSREQIARKIKSMKMYDSGSCSESCEPFSCTIGDD